MNKSWEQYKDEVLQDYENQAKKYRKGDREAFLKITAKKYKVNETTVWNRICSLRKKRKAEQLKKIKEEKFDLGKFGIFSREEMIKQIDRMEKHNKKVKGKLRGDWINFLNQLHSTITKENGFDVKQAAKIDQILQDYNLMKLSQTKVKEIADSLPSYINDISELGLKPDISQVVSQNTNEPRRYQIIANELRDNRQRLLDVNKALWDIIDPHKLVRFCDKQMTLQQKRKSIGGMNVIFVKLAEIFNQKVNTIAARYYTTKRNHNNTKNKKLSEIELLRDEISKYTETIISLETNLNDFREKFVKLQEDYKNSQEAIVQISNLLEKREITLTNLKERPLIKLSLFIESIISKLKGRIL